MPLKSVSKRFKITIFAFLTLVSFVKGNVEHECFSTDKTSVSDVHDMNDKVPIIHEANTELSTSVYENMLQLFGGTVSSFRTSQFLDKGKNVIKGGEKRILTPREAEIIYKAADEISLLLKENENLKRELETWKKRALEEEEKANNFRLLLDSCTSLRHHIQSMYNNYKVASDYFKTLTDKTNLFRSRVMASVREGLQELE